MENQRMSMGTCKAFGDFHCNASSNRIKMSVMANEKFTIYEAFQYGWDTFRAHIRFFLGLMVVIAAINFVPGWLASKIFAPHTLMLGLSRFVLAVINVL